MLQQLPQLRIHWLDGSGSTAETRLTIGAMLTVAEIESAAPVLVAALSAVSDAVFTHYEIIYNVVPAVGVFDVPASDVLRCGVFIFQDEGSEDIGLVEVHGIKDDLLEVSGPGAGVLIIQSDTRVVDFVDAVHDGGACDPFGVALGALAAAYRQSRA